MRLKHEQDDESHDWIYWLEKLVEEVEAYDLILQTDRQKYCGSNVFFPTSKNGVKQKMLSKADY